ncbi:MAG: hypothetical protein ABI843_10175 [Dokdonella sp.]
MSIIKVRTNACLFLLAAMIATDSFGYGFGDQGFVQTPVVRTDLPSPLEGTAAYPLQVSGCHFGQDPCPTLPTVYPQSNFWSQNYPASCVPGFTCPTHWWTVILNNEPNDVVGNSGPPDASLPRSLPGSGIMGFTTLHGNDNFPGDTYWRAHLVLALKTNPVRGGLPYL